MAKANLNNYVDWFEFVIEGTTTRVREPIGWAKVDISLIRNKKYYGFTQEIIGKEQSTLEFDYNSGGTGCIPGGNLLIEQYGLYGSDAVVLFRFGYTDETNTDIVVYEADIDFVIYSKNRKTVTVGARRISFDDLFKNRFNEIIDITTDTDLNGDPITPKVPIEIGLHSKGLFNISDRKSPDSFAFNESVDCTDPITIKNSGLLEFRYQGSTISAGLNVVHREKLFIAQPSFGGIVTEDLQGNQNIPDGIGDTGVNPQWVLEEAGSLTLDLGLSWDASIHLSKQWRQPFAVADIKIDGCTRGDARMGHASIKLKLKVGSTIYTLYTKEDFNAGCNLKYFSTNKFMDACSLTPANALSEIDLIPTSEDFINSSVDNFELSLPVNNFNPEWTTFNVTQTVSVGDEIALYVEIFAEGEYNENTIKPTDLGWFGDAIFWETDSSVTPNVSFMNINVQTVTPESTAKSCLIHETGSSIVEIMTGDANRLRSTILGRTDSTPIYAADGCASLNAITNGFLIRKFQEDQRPISTSMIEYIDSLQAIYNVGLGLEKEGNDDIVRIEGVEYFYNPEQMYVFDKPYDYKESVAKELIYNNIQIGYKKYLDEGLNLLDEFNTQHEYSTPIRRNKLKKQILSDYSGSGYMIETQRREQFSTAPSDSLKNDDTNFIINVIRDGGGFKSLQDEGFTSVSGVYSPESSYNLLISPKRMFYRWAKWIKGASGKKDQATNSMRFLFGIQNKDLTTEITAPCEQPGLIVESSNVALEDYPNADVGIFIPDNVEFKHQMRWDEFETLRNKLRGNGGGTDDYGYITVPNQDGIMVDIWPDTVNYNMSKQELIIMGLKKG